MFIDKKVTSTYLGVEIRKIKSGQVFVIDVVYNIFCGGTSVCCRGCDEKYR